MYDNLSIDLIALLLSIQQIAYFLIKRESPYKKIKMTTKSKFFYINFLNLGKLWARIMWSVLF